MTYWIAAYLLAGGCTLLLAHRCFGWAPGTSIRRKIASNAFTFTCWPAFWALVTLSVIDGY